MSREQLHNMIDIVDEKELDLLFNLLVKFMPTDKPYEDEINSIIQAEKERINGEIYSHDEVWQ
ncbi:hypothetical protein EII17_04495 [Clostridiales bacterium COT073_COT-073]|nr:hypothetical protein EII17_04495 [Clostridiales bacterium COT073_COT-073]